MFDWKLKATNAIFLEDANGQEGRPFKSRFLQAGLVKYDFGVCLLKKETIDKFVDTFIGQPVIIDHKDDLTQSDRVGEINKIWFSPQDGWFWCSGILTDENAVKLVENGYNVSCQYRITDYANNDENKLHNGNTYDKEILNGVFEHLAIVENPRYEDAFIAVNAILAENAKQANSDDFSQYATIVNERYSKAFEYLKTTKGENMDNETKGIFKSLIEALKARNEAEDDEPKKDKKAENEDVDKRKLIDEVGGILKGKVDEEVWRTIIGKIEKVAYDKSEAGTADNGKAKNEDDDKPSDESPKKDDDPKKDAEPAKNKCENEGEPNYKDLYEELKAKVEKEAENKKAKNSLDALKKVFFEGDYKPEKAYMTQKEGIELGKKLY